jgi:hypothetical protein
MNGWISVSRDIPRERAAVRASTQRAPLSLSPVESLAVHDSLSCEWAVCAGTRVPAAFQTPADRAQAPVQGCPRYNCQPHTRREQQVDKGSTLS